MNFAWVRRANERLPRCTGVALTCAGICTSLLVAACTPFTGRDGSGGGSNTSSTGPSNGQPTSSSTGNDGFACTPSPGSAIGEACGIFVRAGATGDGTLAAPVGTISEAVALAIVPSTKAIYVCTGSFDEAVDLPADVSLFGALDCSSGVRWKDAPGPTDRTILTAASDAVPLTIASGTAALYGFSVTSRNALTEGRSSVAIAILGGQLSLSYGDAHAGDGAKGSAGATPLGMGAGGVIGQGGGAWPAMLCLMGGPLAGAVGGLATVNPACVNSSGGSGGSGGPGGVLGGVGDAAGNGTGGVAGLPLSNSNGGFGAGCNNIVCTACQIGGVGASGALGNNGAPGTGLGTLTATGVEGLTGEAGFTGPSGQGGGGGGGQRTAAFASCGTDGGGGGGTGGCGGVGGTGGGFGGSSIAILSLGANLLIDHANASVGKGAAGGNGAAGQLGGGGAAGGNGHGACGGGKGGDGGSGGTGAGGSGGHAVGLAFIGMAPDTTGLSVDVSSAAPGTGGTGGLPSGMGATGSVAETQMF